MMLGIIVLIIIVVLYLLGWVGLWSVLGAVVLAVGSFGALVYDGPKDRWKRAGFIVLAVAGVGMMVWDAVLA